MVVFLGSAFVAHLFGVGLYALAFAWMHYHPEFGSLAGLAGSNATDFFYFSLTCYSRWDSAMSTRQATCEFSPVWRG